MSLNEVKLTVAIEDPIKREQKEFMGVEVPTQSHLPIATESIALALGVVLCLHLAPQMSQSICRSWLDHASACAG